MTQRGKSETSLFVTGSIYSSKSKKEQELEKRIEKKDAEIAALKNKRPGVVTQEGATRGAVSYTHLTLPTILLV